MTAPVQQTRSDLDRFIRFIVQLSLKRTTTQNRELSQKREERIQPSNGRAPVWGATELLQRARRRVTETPAQRVRAGVTLHT